MPILTAIGLLGVVLVLAAYGLLASGKVAANSNHYQWLNVIGTICILLSLIGQWNLAAFIANAAWLAVGVSALWCNARKRGAENV